MTLDLTHLALKPPGAKNYLDILKRVANQNYGCVFLISHSNRHVQSRLLQRAKVKPPNIMCIIAYALCLMKGFFNFMRNHKGAHILVQIIYLWSDNRSSPGLLHKESLSQLTDRNSLNYPRPPQNHGPPLHMTNVLLTNPPRHRR